MDPLSLLGVQQPCCTPWSHGNSGSLLLGTHSQLSGSDVPVVHPEPLGFDLTNQTGYSASLISLGSPTLLERRKKVWTGVDLHQFSLAMAVCGGAKSKQPRQVQSRRLLPSLRRFHSSMIIFEVIDLAWTLVVTLVDVTTGPWRRMFWFFLHLYFTSWSILLTLFLRIISSPFRLLNAARREKLLEAQLQELQMHYEELGDKKSQLERRLESATRDRRRIKESLDQAVAEWEKSIDRLKLLKSRVQELENQNARLRELEEERKMSKLATNKQDPGNDTKEQEEQEDGNTLVDDSLLMEGRGVALASSIFSGVLSLLVGLISYEAEDPCMPLVIALFTVVVMSLGNVVQFFSKLQSRHGFDAVALLSFNWFMLGTLAFPAFPLIAKILSPFTLQATSWVASWFGIRF